MLKKSFSVLAGLGLLLFCSSSVFASGFAIIEQSVSGLGNAFSGGASAEDATTVFFNPAGMTLLEGQQLVSAAHVIVPSTKFKATTATNALGGDLGDNNGGDGGVVGLVPNLYYTNKLSDKLAIGLGINAPFGLATKYDKEWVGRYHAVESDVMTININPAIAYKLNDKLSIGAGLNIQYIDVLLSSMIDGGLVGVMAGSAIAPSQFENDVYAENTADDWSLGYNLGAIYEFTPNTRIGIAYRSEIKHNLKGEVDTNIPTSLTTTTFHLDPPGIDVPLSVLFPDQNVHGEITLPATASLSFFSQVNDRLAVMADITWTEWSSFKELTIYFDGDGIANSGSTTTTENWDDTWRYSIGTTYQATESLKLRGGLAYDETPISDDYRTPRIPGEDRFWVSLGCGYQITESIGLDFAYAHLFVKDSKMQKFTDLTDPTNEDNSRGTVVGEFENAVDIASVQFNYRF